MNDKLASIASFATALWLAAHPVESLAGAVLKLGDILVVEPGAARVSVVDANTGSQSTLSDGGLLLPEWKTVGVALASDGDVVAVHRSNGLIRINPITGAQSVLSQGGHFRDPWAIAIDRSTGYVFVADSGFAADGGVNEAGKIIRVHPTTGVQDVIATGTPCNAFPQGAACRNTTSAGAYLAHPYGIAIDYHGVPGTLVVADMGSFDGTGAIIRIDPVPGGAQTLLWGPASAVPPPRVASQAPLACPMGVAVEPSGNVLATTFTFPVPSAPTSPPPPGTYYGCAPPGVFRIDLASQSQSVLTANAPSWQASRVYAAGETVRDTGSPGFVHRATTAGTSSATSPAWNATIGGLTVDGGVTWQNLGRADDWLIPFGLDIEPAPTPSGYNIVASDEGRTRLYRLDASGALTSPALNTAVAFVTAVDVIDAAPPGGFKVEPIPFNGQPEGELPAGTTQATLSLATQSDASCRYSTTPGVTYAAMTGAFSVTGTTTHSTIVVGLSNGGAYAYYVRCIDGSGQANSADYLIAFSVGTPPPPPSVQPLMALGFEEGSGNLLIDVTGNGNHGSISGATWSTQGRFGKALAFDGIDDLVTVADSPTLDLVGGMTIEAWVYPTSGSGAWRNVLIKERAGGEVYNLYARAASGAPAAYVVRSSPSTAVSAAGPSALPLNTWSHLAATYDGTILRLYVNAVQVGSQSAPGTILTSTGALRLGGNTVWGEHFAGLIDEVRVYNRALTPAELASDMATAVGGSAVPDVPPVRSDGQPSGVLAAGTTQATLSLLTGESATCRYAVQAGVAYASMAGSFSTTGGMTHSTTVTGLAGGTSYTYYVRCIDGAGNANPDDFAIAFSVSASGVASSTFPGVQNPLSENGAWDSPGAWADLAVNNGAYAPASNALGRRVSPPIASDQYAEITFDQDPGASSWVGVVTRVQSATNGSGYLAIAYAGEVRLYRVDDAGSLSFTQLAAAAADLAAAPRRLTLESQGNTHRVYFNDVLLITHVATGTIYSGGQPGIAASVFGGPQVKILTFDGGNLSGAGPDITPPIRVDGQPSGVLVAGTTQATLSLLTGESATCRYAVQAGVAYASMAGTFATSGGMTHSTTLTGLADGASYTYYVRCIDGAGNANPDDFAIAFSVSASGVASSTFPGVQNPLSENGAWDSPGAWADLAVNNGAYATATNALGRRVSPPIASDQYSEITFDQDPGASSWVGVVTRVQSATNGSGYLAIAYAGEVRLYRVDDAGSLSFVQLAAATADLAAAPRRLTLESQGDTHRVYFNDVLLITHVATGTIYSGGQPGIAASVFGGPQVKILTFEGGDLSSAAPDTTPPSAPTGLTATADGSNAINLAWTAATDDVGVAGYRVERCSGSSCTNFVEIATFAATTFRDSPLNPSTTYRYRVRAGDAAANLGAYSNIASATTTAPPDTIPPTVVSHVPAVNASGIVRTANITVTFSEPMTSSSINTTTIELRDAVNNLVTSTVSYSSSTRTATLNPSPTLAWDSVYTVTVKGGATDPRVKDSAGNALASNYTWSFRTEVDITPPTVSSRSPAIGATGVSRTANVTATFNEPMNATSIGSTTFELRDPVGSIVPATVSYNSTSRVATLNPSATLAYLTTYTATIIGGASGVKDASDNPLAADVTWSFTTVADTTPPTVSSVSPAANATNVSRTANVTATFNEAMDPATISGVTFELRTAAGTLIPAVVTYDPVTRRATLNPDPTLAGVTLHTATVRGGASGVKDAQGVALAVDRVWSFTTRP